MTSRIPYVIALLTLIGGVFISILFGANEELFKKIDDETYKDGEDITLQEYLSKMKNSAEFPTPWTRISLMDSIDGKRLRLGLLPVTEVIEMPSELDSD